MRKGVWYGLLTGLALLLAACGGGGQPQPDLTLAGISPQNPAVVQGETVTLTLTFTSQNGFQGQVSLSVLEGGQPVSWLSPNSVQRNLNVPRGQQVQETLEVQVAPNAPTGSRNLTVRAAYGNQVTERALTLTVNAPPSFTLSDPTPNPLNVQAGGTETFQVTLTSQNGFQGQVTLSLADGQDPLPQGLAISATNPSPINLQAGGSVTVTATVSADAQVAPGTYRLKVRATSGSLIREADLTVVVTAPPPPPDVTLSLNPTSLSIQQGGSGTTQLTITPQNGFTGTVSLSLVDGSGNPVPDITLDPTNVNVTGSSPVTQNLTVSVGSGVAPGIYSLQVQATSGSLTKTANLSLAVSGPGTTWTRRTSGTTESLYGVTYGNGMFVVVGRAGTILTSPNGVSWTRQTSGTGYALQGVTYGNGTFVAVGQGGTILTSPDGVNWTQRTSGTTESLYGVTYSNGTFVAVGGYGTILTSPDGVAWTGRFSGTRNWIYNVTYGNGKFVAVEGGDAFIISLDNGFTWTRRTAGIAPPPGYSYVGLGGVTYGNGKFVAVGNRATILTSPDGETWTQQDSGASTINNLFSVTYGNGTFVAVGYPGTILTSPDGENWTQRTSGTTEGLYGVAYGNGTFVAVGGGGTILTSP